MNLLLKINHLISKTGGAWSIKDDDIPELLTSIVANFYSDLGKRMATTCRLLFNRSGSRDFTHRFLEDICEYEMLWREEHQNEVFANTLCNPLSFDTVSYSDICRMPKNVYRVVYERLIRMNYENEYVKTQYFKATEGKVLEIKRQCDIKGCEIQEGLRASANDPVTMGKDHEKVSDGFQVLCKKHYRVNYVEAI